MFSGQYQHNIDAKGRVIMPARFREMLGEAFVITAGFEGCLRIYSNEGWEQFTEKLRRLPDGNPNARRLKRLFASNSIECEVDKQGRVLVPSNLRKHAHLDKDVIIIGAIETVEIWSLEEWEKYNNNDDSITLEEAAARLDNFEF